MSSSLENLIYDYQQCMLGNNRSRAITKSIWSDNAEYNDALARGFLSYFVEHFLHWTPTEMREKFNQNIVNQFELGSVIKWIILPLEAEPTDYYIYAHCCYPHRIPYNFKQQTIICYERKVNAPIKRYAREFFSDSKGRERAIICLQHVLSRKEAFASKEQMYQVFASKKGYSLLSKHFLTLPVNSGYKDGVRQGVFQSPIDYLHASLSPGERDNVLYLMYKYWDKLDSSKLFSE